MGRKRPRVTAPPATQNIPITGIEANSLSLQEELLALLRQRNQMPEIQVAPTSDAARHMQVVRNLWERLSDEAGITPADFDEFRVQHFGLRDLQVPGISYKRVATPFAKLGEYFSNASFETVGFPLINRVDITNLLTRAGTMYENLPVRYIEELTSEGLTKQQMQNVLDPVMVLMLLGRDPQSDPQLLDRVTDIANQIVADGSLGNVGVTTEELVRRIFATAQRSAEYMQSRLLGPSLVGMMRSVMFLPEASTQCNPFSFNLADVQGAIRIVNSLHERIIMHTGGGGFQMQDILQSTANRPLMQRWTGLGFYTDKASRNPRFEIYRAFAYDIFRSLDGLESNVVVEESDGVRTETSAGRTGTVNYGSCELPLRFRINPDNPHMADVVRPTPERAVFPPTMTYADLIALREDLLATLNSPRIEITTR